MLEICWQELAILECIQCKNKILWWAQQVLKVVMGLQKCSHRILQQIHWVLMLYRVTAWIKVEIISF